MLPYYTETMTQETEIKLAIAHVEEAVARIEERGFAVAKPRVFERNLVFDNARNELRKSRQLLRLRDAGGHATLTYKGAPADGGKHKSREERETGVADFAEMKIVLERLGYAVGFVYEKFRTEFTRPGTPVTITLDETPIGNFLEIEGPPASIDETAHQLGFEESDYITGSYGALYAEWSAKNPGAPANMEFTGSVAERDPASAR